MIVSMKQGATRQQLARVRSVIQSHNLTVHSMRGKERVVIGVVGVGSGANHCQEVLEPMEGVESVVRISAPYKFVSLQTRNQPTRIKLRSATIGGNGFTLMAGPCSVESREQLSAVAAVVSACGGKVLRGGAFKPRTSPYEFQGLGEKGLELLAEAGEKYDLATVTEVMDPRQAALVAKYVDLLQVGARNMQNFDLLKELGNCKKPVLLKRGMSATIKEWLMSAEYLFAHGNRKVVLCERGIRSFDSETRNVFDIAAAPVLRTLTHLPVVLDPSHAAGRRDIVPALCYASAVVGADGLIIEVHPCPDKAVSDGKQSLTLQQFRAMAKKLEKFLQAMG